jgi:hypothetical protein
MTDLIKSTPFWKTDRFWWIVYGVLTVFVSIKTMLTEEQATGMVKVGNGNFTIFYQSFHHLIEGKTLYGFYPQEYENRFNYSPFFALLMTPFALLPYTLGGILWNICNGIFFFSAIRKLHIDTNKKVLVYFCLIFDTFTTLGYFQTNPSLTALLIWSVVFMERGKVHWATCLLMLGTWTKILPFLGCIFWLLYPKKVQFIAYCVLWSVLFFALPLTLVSFNHLLFLYSDWYVWLTKHAAMHGESNWLINAHSLMKRAFHIYIDLKYFIVIGGLLLLGSIAYKRAYVHELTFKMLVLANILIFLTIFNPGAEPPTYIIAATGVVIWYIYSPYSTFNLVVGLFAFIIVAFAQSDLFPFQYFRKQIIHGYALKALPCLIVWIMTIIQLYRYTPEKSEEKIIL